MFHSLSCTLPLNADVVGVSLWFHTLSCTLPLNIDDVGLSLRLLLRLLSQCFNKLFLNL